MKAATSAVLSFAITAVGCGAAREVAHVAATPVRVIHHETSSKPPQPTSDVDNPGRPVTATPSPTPRVTQAKPKPSISASPKVAPSPPQFPVAKAVPGKPGLVYNPFDPKGSLIDVSGYAPGSKVKDPDSQKIFIVP
jgi:hypothetical protein